MIQSRITAKAQTTIPRAVREALGVGAGDTLAYRIEDEVVILTRALDPDMQDNPYALFTGWADDLDPVYDYL
jgi:AbrB family looped-hinge helix DNA binding protein